MEMKRVVARFMVHKVGSFVVKERVLCFGEYGFSTFDRENEQLTNTWAYEDVDGANVLEGETDFVILTPRHRVKKTVYRCHYRMEVMVCLMRLRSQHAAKLTTGQPSRPELQTHAFDCIKYLKKGLQVKCIVEIRPDGVYQKDTEGELMSHIPYTSLVSIDVICDDHDAILLNHSDNSSLFIVPGKRTELAEAIRRVMKAYGMPINEYRKKTLARAVKDDPSTPASDEVSCQYGVLKVSQSNESATTPRVLAISEKYIIEYVECRTLISSRPLSRVYSLILFQDTKHAFEIVYVDGIRRKYYSEQREKIICELLSSCHAVGNHQVAVEMGQVPDWVQMVPQRVIQAEGAKMRNKTPDVNVQARELRVAQSIILQLLAVHGYSKTPRVQRQLPRGLDEEMHSLAVELNVNTPTEGVIAQPNKPYEKVVFVAAREIHDIVMRHGGRHDFLCTYLQTLHRVMLLPQAKDEFIRILNERGEEYISTITKILTSRRPVTIYWMFMVMLRLIESKTHKATFRQIVLSNNLFVVTILSLFDEVTQTQEYLSDLPTMKLCEFVLALVKANIEKQHKLSEMLYQHLATKYRMMLRILFGFPALGTVEACVGILGRMTKNPAFLHFGNMSSPVRSRDGQIPRHSLSFGETMNYGVAANRTFSSRLAAPPLSRNYLSSSRFNNVPSSRYNSVSSVSSVSSVGTGVVAVQNPEVLLKQYRLFVESSCGQQKTGLEQYDDPVFLRLRYRCRNVFLQELMSHMVGSFEDFKRVYGVECHQFSGFLSSSDGQREKSDLFLTPRALIAVRVLNHNTNEFEFRAITDITVAVSVPNTFAIAVKGKIKYVYSDQSADILDKMTDLAGVIGINLLATTRDTLPKPSFIKALREEEVEPADVMDVQRRTGRHGFTLYNKKKLLFVDGTIQEIADGEEKTYSLKALRRVVVPILNPDNDTSETTVVLDFVDGARIVYAPYDIDVFLAALYDSYRQVRNWMVSLAHDFSRINPRMTARALLHDDQERQSMLNQEGLYLSAHAALTKAIERMSRDGTNIASGIEKVIFTLESMIMNVEMEDFAGKQIQVKLDQLSFSGLLRGITQLLENACKPPIRGEEVAIILDSFCRVNDGCYQMTLALTDSTTSMLVSLLSQVLVSGNVVATVWAVNTFQSLIMSKARSAEHASTEKRVRFQVLENKKLLQLLVGVLEQRNPIVTLAVLELFVDVLIHSRQLTDNNQFEAIVKAFSSKYAELLRLVSQNGNGGIKASAICILKVVVDHSDSKTRQRICDAALEKGLTVQCFYKALFHPVGTAREVYQYIAGIWMTHHKPSFDMLVRILPRGFIRMLSHSSTRKLMRKERDRGDHTTSKGQFANKMDARLDCSESHIKRVQREVASLFKESSSKTPKVKLDNARVNYPGESPTDIQLLSRMVHRDFHLPDLIWNDKSRGELRSALEKTIDEFEEFKNSRTSAISLITSQARSKELLWSYEHFQVTYGSLANELEVGGFYVRVLWERINEGSVRLGEIAKIIQENGVQNGFRGKIKGHSESFYSCIEIVKNPAAFFNEVYQCWLENLYTTISRCPSKDSGSCRSGSLQSISSVDKYEQNGDWLLKLLIALARAFPGVGSVTKHRAQFLLSFLKSSYAASDIRDVLELLGQMTGSVEAAKQFCSRSNLELFLYLSLLAHRGQRGSSVTVRNSIGNEDVPVMELQPLSDAGRVSSVPIAGLSFYDNSRFNLKWSVKVDTVSDKGTTESSSLVAGPFTAVELRQFLDTDPSVLLGDVQRICVCCCSSQERDDATHTHQWTSIFAVPELRWLELTDESIDTECATFALQILRNFLGNSRVPRSSTCEYWPLPMATTVISSSSALPLLTQLLLVNDSARSHVCEILLCLEDSVAENLYNFGAFFFLLAGDVKLSAKGSFLSEARFLSKFHRIQRVKENHYGQSCLLDILPESLIGLLDSDTPEHFADVYTSRKRDKRILWSSSMRQHLQEMLHEHLRDFANDLAQNVTATYNYVSLPPVTYSELSGDVYCSGYYLSTFIQADADLEAIEEPVILMSSIEDKWRYLVRRQSRGAESQAEAASAYELFGWKQRASYNLQDLRERYRDVCRAGAETSEVRKAFDLLSTLYDRKDEVDAGKTSDDVIDCILKAQLKLLEHFSIQFSSYYCKSLDLLLNLLTKPDSDGASSDGFTSLAMKVLSKMLTAAPHNSARLLEIDGSWDAILETVEKYAFRRDIEAKELMFSILQLILASDGGMQSLITANNRVGLMASSASNLVSHTREDEDDEASFFTATEYISQNNGDVSIAKYAERIYTLLDDVILSFENIQPWHIQKLSFDIVSEICRNLAVRDQILTTTRVFWKGLYLILASAASTEAEQNSGSKLEQQERDMLESAFRSLRALAIGTDGTSRSKGLDALANLLPLDFLDCLDKPNGHEFCAIILSDIEEPSCIWNTDTREELSLLTEEYCMSESGDELSILESATSYMYDCLQSEPRVGGIYLNVLLSKGTVHPESITANTLFPASPTSFLEALFLFLEENRDPKLGIYSDTLPALECLSLLADASAFRNAFVEVLELHADDPDASNAAISVATLGRYLLPFDGNTDPSKAVSISSRRSLSTYGFKSRHGPPDAAKGADSLESQFGNTDYQKRQELALLVLNKLCGFPTSLEKMMAPFCQYTWALQVITDHLGYEQAYYALSCLAELCDTCLTVAEYVEVSGLWVEILGLALQSKQHVLHEHFLRAEALREPAFEVIYALLDKDPSIHERMYNDLLRFLPYPIVYQIHLDPSKAARFFDDNHEKSDLIWNSHKRTAVRKKLDEIICRNRAERSVAKRDSVLLEEHDRIEYASNFVGGLYIDRFLSRPDPEKLTSPAYNLELLFQLWRTDLERLMDVDLQNPPESLRTTADSVEKLTTAITIILRTPLDIDDRISTSGMPEQIVKLVRHCNKHLITSFPYRCILRIARRLVQFPLICSGEFLELLFCRMTIQHADIPSLVKLVRRILESRSASAEADGKKEEPAFLLRDLKYCPQVVALLEGLVADKEHVEAALLSNANRVLRILHAENPKEESFKSVTRSFMGRWHNFTIAETRSSMMRASIKTTEASKQTVAATAPRPSTALISTKSFDVDKEREPMNGTFCVDDERKAAGVATPRLLEDEDEESFEAPAPPKSIKYDGGNLEVVDAIAPSSFRYSGNLPNDASVLSPMPMSMSVTYDLIDSKYHSQKAVEYDDEVDIDELRGDTTRRGSLPEMSKAPRVNGTMNNAPRYNIPMSGINPGTGYTDFTDSAVPLRSEDGVRDSDMTSYTNWSGVTSERRYSVLDSWKAPSSSQTNASLMSVTITRRGRRAAANYSRNKSRQQKKWYSFKR